MAPRKSSRVDIDYDSFVKNGKENIRVRTILSQREAGKPLKKRWKLTNPKQACAHETAPRPPPAVPDSTREVVKDRPFAAEGCGYLRHTCQRLNITEPAPRRTLCFVGCEATRASEAKQTRVFASFIKKKAFFPLFFFEKKNQKTFDSLMLGAGKYGRAQRAELIIVPSMHAVLRG